MATIAIAITLDPALQWFEIPEGFYVGPNPYGELVFSSEDDAIAAKDAANTNVVTMTGTFVPAWIYRLVEARVVLSGVDLGDFNEVEPAMALLFTENNVNLKETQLYNYSPAAFVDANQTATIVRNPSVTLDFRTVYGLAAGDVHGMRSDLLDASVGTSQMQIISVNQSGNASSAMGISCYFRFLLYTIAQQRAGAIWNAIPTV